MIHNPNIFNSWQLILEHALNPKQIISNQLVLNTFFEHRKNNYALIAIGKGSSAFAQAIFDKFYSTNNYMCLDNHKYMIDNRVLLCDHPLPSKRNCLNSKKLVKFITSLDNKLPILSIICGGSSAMLTDPINSLGQTINVNKMLLASSLSISKINIVRKHSDLLKGGGLAKLYYPKESLNLFVSDVDNDDISIIGSGPIVLDKSQKYEAQDILRQINIDNYSLIDTPKDQKYFEKCENHIIFNRKLLLNNFIQFKNNQNIYVGHNVLSNSIDNVVDDILNTLQNNHQLYIFSGEPRIKVEKSGYGGRCAHLALTLLKDLKDKESYNVISFATDGLDNSEYAGVAFSSKDLSGETSDKEIDQHLNNFDSYSFFEKYKCTIKTGPLPVNVSDLLIISR